MNAGVSIERNTGTMRSPINWSLLGLVIQRSSYGYELVQRFERMYGEALELSSPSQIYTALDILERRNLIELLPARASAEPSRQPKPHYRVTPAGMTEYVDWLVSHVQDERRRSRLFAQQIAALPAREALTVIERCEHQCLHAATAAPAGKRRRSAESADSAVHLTDRLIDEEERLIIDARLAWIEYARRELRALLRRGIAGR
jgi:DNA-binding PadR family transcriptional regulator